MTNTLWRLIEYLTRREGDVLKLQTSLSSCVFDSPLSPLDRHVRPICMSIDHRVRIEIYEHLLITRGICYAGNRYLVIQGLNFEEWNILKEWMYNDTLPEENKIVLNI